MSQEILDSQILVNCDACVSEKEERKEQKIEQKKEKMGDKRASAESWVWLIKKVERRPVSEIICLIPKIRHFDLFGDLFEVNPVKKFQQDYLILLKMVLKYDDDDLDLGIFLENAIKAGNVELVKFVATKIGYREFSTNLPNYIKLAENTFNVEILEYLNSMT